MGMDCQSIDRPHGSIVRSVSLRLVLLLLDQWPLKWTTHYTLEGTHDNLLLAQRSYLEFFPLKIRKKFSFTNIDYTD